MSEEYRIQNAVRNAITDYENGRQVGASMAVVVPMLPLILPPGFVGYGAYSLATGWQWHPMFCWVAAIFAAIASAVILFRLFAHLPSELWLLAGAILGGFLGWSFGTNVIMTDQTWSAGLAALGVLIFSGWFFLISAGAAWLLSVEKVRLDGRDYSFLMLGLVAFSATMTISVVFGQILGFSGVFLVLLIGMATSMALVWWSASVIGGAAVTVLLVMQSIELLLFSLSIAAMLSTSRPGPGPTLLDIATIIMIFGSGSGLTLWMTRKWRSERRSSGRAAAGAK